MADYSSLLATVLRAYRDPPNPAEENNILAKTNTLLANLKNPLNLSVLTSNLLAAPALWQSPHELHTCMRVLSVYNTAAIHVRRNELVNSNTPTIRMKPLIGSGLSSEAWTRATLKGLDEKTNRWKQVLVLTGILIGMEADNRRSLSSSLRSTLERAIVESTNWALVEPLQTGLLGCNAVVLALTFAFPLLSDSAKQQFNCNALLPSAVEGMLGAGGFQCGDFITFITNDVRPTRGINWRIDSPSVTTLQHLVSGPLMQNMGPVTRLVSFAIEHASDCTVVAHVHDLFLDFTKELFQKWSYCPLSSIDLASETAKLSPDVLQGPYPMLWQVLKKILYSVASSLHSIATRSLLDPFFRDDTRAPVTAAMTLAALRNMSFISTRENAGFFGVYVFTYLASLDIITRYTGSSVAYLESIQPPASHGLLVPSPVIQALTLFYLNVAEQMAPSLPTPTCEALIISPATAHLSPTSSWLLSPANSNPRSSLTRDIFEAAHSAVLAVLSCPQHAALTIKLVPIYVTALLSSFPSRISPRQFRHAFRIVMQIASPPFPISASEPGYVEAVLEMVRHHAITGAATQPTLPLTELPTKAEGRGSGAVGVGGEEPPAPMISEQAGLVLAVIDALPYVPLPHVADWLSLVAEAVSAIADPGSRAQARSRFCDVLVSGELDVERSAVAVAWWGSGGGSVMALGPPAPANGGEFVMSGALGLGREGSRL